MKKNYSTLRGMMASAAAVFAYIILALTLCTIAGYAAETGNGSTANKPLELPIRENPVAAGYSDYYVILENGTLIQSVADKVKGLTGTGFTFNQTVELMDNVAAVYAASETGGGSDIVLAVDRDGTLWARFLPDWGVELTIGKEVSAEGWFKLEENVAMASVDKFHAVILKRDGSLWVAGRDEYGAPWLETDHNGFRFGDPYYAKIMDNVIWADTSYYGAYAVTAGHELWGWGFSPDDTGPEKLAENVAQVSAADMAVTVQGELLSWICTKNSSNQVFYARTEPRVVLKDVVQCGKGYIIKSDGTLWASGATWGPAKDLLVGRYVDSYGPYDLAWGTVGYGTGLQKIAVEDAACAAIGAKGMVVLDKNGTLWGIYDLNTEWDGPFQPFSPVRLMDGCYGAEEPAGDGMKNFTVVHQYWSGRFSDVKTSDWFYDNVKAAYELGLMNGNNGAFLPNGTITLAEAMTIAARLRATYRGDPTVLASAWPWYQPYVNYCLATQIHKLVLPGSPDFNRPATRAELACLLSRALPQDAFPAVNSGITFSDVGDSHIYREYINRMVEAGIMQGKGWGRFDPDAPVSRSEAAAMLSRCAWPDLRLS